MTPSRDLVSHSIQQHSIKFTNCTSLSPCSWRLIFLIHQTSFIYCWELVFLHCIVENRTSRYLIYWEALPPSFYCNFDIYLLISHLLEYDLTQLGPVGDLGLFSIFTICELMSESFYSQPKPWSVACVIAKKRFWSIQNLRLLEPPYGW